jgi:hypothetical protein
MATFIPHPSGDEDRPELSLEQAKDFASRFCQPQDNALVEDFDETARETAWRLLQALEELQHQHSEGHVCEKCQAAAAEEEESIGEEVEQEVAGAETPETSTIDKLNEIADNSKELLKDATKAVATTGAVVAASTTTATAAPSITASIGMFVQDTTSKAAAIGTAGLMSIGSGAYFQAKTAKEEGIEIAVVSEQQYGIFSNANIYTEALFGVAAFDTIVKYAEEGYGDVEGTNPSGDGDGEGGDDGTTSTGDNSKNPIKYEEVKDDPQVSSVGDQ